MSTDPFTSLTLVEDGQIVGVTVADENGQAHFSPPVSDGEHTFTVRATDAAGNTGSDQLSFTVDTSPPDVTMALAHDTGSSSSDHITSDSRLIGTTDPLTSLTFLDDGVTIGVAVADASGRWSFTPQLADGQQTITIQGSDFAGNVATETFTWTVDTTAPTVTLELANDTGKSSSDNLTNDQTLRWSTDPYVETTFIEGGKVLATAQADAQGRGSISLGLSDGAHTIVVQTTDTAGNTASASLDFTVDTSPPVVTVSLADDTGSSSSDGITSDSRLTGTTDPLTSLTVVDDGVTIGVTVADASGKWSFTPKLADGQQTITIIGSDFAGNVATETFTWTVDSSTPDVMVALANDTGSSSSDGVTSDPTLRWSTDPYVETTFMEGGAVLAAIQADAQGRGSVSLGLSDGAHTIVVQATDAAGNTGSDSLTFTVDTTAPTVTLALTDDTGVSSSDHITSRPSLSVSTDPFASLTLVEDGQIVGVTVADASGHADFSPSTFPTGSIRSRSTPPMPPATLATPR